MPSTFARPSLVAVLLATMAFLFVIIAPASAAVSGDELWHKIYTGPGDGGDAPDALAVAPGGKAIYVAGSVTPGGALESDLGLVKYTAGGKRVWARTYGGSFGGNERAGAVVCDTAGNVYVGGYTTKAAGQDFLLIKYAPSGARRWVRAWDGPGHDDDSIADLALDASGNVYAAGKAYVAATGTDAAVAKWTPSGRRAWAKVYPSADMDHFDCIAIDKARGRIYAAGVDGGTSTTSWLLARYGTGGTRKWASSVGDPGTRFATTSLALPPGGNAVVAGGSNTGTSGSNDGRIGRWTAGGDFFWSSGFYGSAADYDVIHDIAVGRDGDIVAVGVAKQFADNYDAFLIVYRADGSTRGSRYLGDIFDDNFTEVACDAGGNIYAAGKRGMSPSASQFWTMKFSPTLVPRWEKVKNISAVSADDHPTDIAVRGGDAPGLYVTGTAATTGAGWGWLTLKYKP